MAAVTTLTRRFAPDSPLKAGALVALRSGGPPMTVRSITSSGKGAETQLAVAVDWFSGDEANAGSFLAAQLIVVEFVAEVAPAPMAEDAASADGAGEGDGE